jgi:glucose uptake protein
MFTPHTSEIALMMMIASAICWGSWANTYKGVKNYRFELFYWDYAVGIFLISVVLAFTLGSTTQDATSFLNNVRAADTGLISTLTAELFSIWRICVVAAITWLGWRSRFRFRSVLRWWWSGFELHLAARRRVC